MGIRFFSGLIVGLGLFAGCESNKNKIDTLEKNDDHIKISDSNSLIDTTSSNPKNLIRIKDMKFIPEELEIVKGDTVYWFNEDPFVHNVVESTSEKWTSPELETGKMWYRVFTEEEKYYCKFHKIMTGNITITNP